MGAVETSATGWAACISYSGIPGLLGASFHFSFSLEQQDTCIESCPKGRFLQEGPTLQFPSSQLPRNPATPKGVFQAKTPRAKRQPITTPKHLVNLNIYGTSTQKALVLAATATLRETTAPTSPPRRQVRARLEFIRPSSDTHSQV